MNKQITKMKKRVNWLSAAAFATILAACSNDVVLRDDVQLPTDSPKAIGFSSFSEKSTRGDVGNASYLEYYHSSFTVYASKKSIVDDEISEVFDGGTTALVTFSNNAEDPNEWTYAPYRYWDKQANYKFIAVAPNADIVKYDWDATASPLTEVGTDANDFVTVDGGYTLVGQNLQATATAAEITKGFIGGNGKDTDIMTSEVKSEAYNRVAGDVVLNFKHILAKLNVTVAKALVLNDADVYVKSLEISGLKDKGVYDESEYHLNAGAADPDPTKSGWTASVASATYKLAYDYANDANKVNTQDGFELSDATSATVTVPTYFIESLVMPQAVAANDATLILKYQIVTGTGATAHKENYTYTLDMNAAFASYLDRHNYTLKLTINPTVITFDATAAGWDNGGTQNITIE